MTACKPDPFGPAHCPWCTRTEHVEPATDHEQDRTGCRWWCTSCKQLFHGTATEYQRIRVEVTASLAERMATNPKENR